MTITHAGSRIACDMPAAKPSATCGGSDPPPSMPAGASERPGRFASRRDCMNAAMDAEPITDPMVRVVL
jgi:hypothetical protein